MTGWSVGEAETDNQAFERFIANAKATRQHNIEARVASMEQDLVYFIMLLGLPVLGEVESGIIHTDGRQPAVWAEATVFVHPEYDPDKAWEPTPEPLCWKVALRRSDAWGFYAGLTVRAWHRAQYQDTIYVNHAVADHDNTSRELLALSIATAMDRECTTETDVAALEARQRERPEDRLVQAIRDVAR